MQLDLGSAVTSLEGNPNAKVCFISGVPSWEGKPLSDAGKSFIFDTAARVGIKASDICLRVILDAIPRGRQIGAASQFDIESGIKRLLEGLAESKNNILVPLGDFALQALTNHQSCQKWQLSIIEATKAQNQKTIPLIHPERIFADYGQFPYFSFGMSRIKEEMEYPMIVRKIRTPLINPSFDQSMEFLHRCKTEEHLSIDIETARGQITCIGFAPNETEAICIPSLPDQYITPQFHMLWSKINEVLSGNSKKIFQNFIYDCTYLSKYGMVVSNLWHDSMLAQKFLHPELTMGLDTVARLYTREPYWKDEGKDWARIDNLDQFYYYNCKDTTITLEASFAQRKDLAKRNLIEAFEKRVMSLCGPAAEMCWRGLPVDLGRREAVRLAFDTDIADANNQLADLTRPFVGEAGLNSRSPKQVKEYLKKKKYRLPTKKNSKGQRSETSDVTALLKLQQSYPTDQSLALLILLSEKNKSVSSYLKPMPYADGRMRYRIGVSTTDSGRWTAGLDPWDNGFNPQTIPSQFKSMFVAPEGWKFLEVDLEQADSRFVAWDAPEPTLIKFYTEGTDIHKFVASRPELFNKPIGEISKDERQLGKKVGHASNYGMRGARLSEICLLEMGISLNSTRADQMLQGYHRVFPGIGFWQKRIESEIRKSKRLGTPLGRERVFYDRLGDNLFRTAYAYRPQSTVCDVINSLIVWADHERDPKQLHHILQVHDSYICLVRDEYIEDAKKIIFNTEAWNPKMSLPGGILQIPIKAKIGADWGNMKEINL